MPWKPSAVLVMALLLAGCQTTTGTDATSVCAVWRPISWSVKDTPDTTREIVLNNARRSGYCK